jgi:hypothetical protein
LYGHGDFLADAMVVICWTLLQEEGHGGGALVYETAKARRCFDSPNGGELRNLRWR